MKRAVILKHVAHEGAGRIGALCSARGYALETRELYRGDAVPDELAPSDVLVVMGGPMGVGDLEQPAFPFLRRELALLQRRIREDAPVLGVCLGAQLLAAAAGARVYPMADAGRRLYEVGWSPLRFRTDDESDALFDGLPRELPVLHWHGDTFDLPAGARLLASSSACANQAFRLGRRLFGLQFHCETYAEDVDRFLSADADFVTLANGPGGVERLREETSQCMGEFGRLGERWLDNVLHAMTED